MTEPTPSPVNRAIGELIFDLLIGIKRGSFADLWFRWAEWILVTAGLYVLGVKAGSWPVKLFAYVSAALLFFHVWYRLEGQADRVMAASHGMTLRLRYCLLAGVMTVMLTALIIVAKAIQAAVSSV
jgi:hypothetical protein